MNVGDMCVVICHLIFILCTRTSQTFDALDDCPYSSCDIPFCVNLGNEWYNLRGTFAVVCGKYRT